MCLIFGFVDIGWVSVKVLWIICRFAVAEGKLKKPTVKEGGFQFLCSESGQRRKC